MFYLLALLSVMVIGFAMGCEYGREHPQRGRHSS